MHFFKLSILAVLLYCTLSNGFVVREDVISGDLDGLRFNLWDKVSSLVDTNKLKEKVSAAVDKVVHLSKEMKEKLKPIITSFIEHGKPIAKELWVDIKPILIELLKQKILKPSKREIEIDSRSDIKEKISALVDKLGGKSSDLKQKLKDALINLVEHGKPIAKELLAEAKPILSELLKSGIKILPTVLPIILSLVGKRDVEEEETRFNLWDKVSSLVDKAKLKEKVSAAVDKVVHLSKQMKDKLKPVILDFIEFSKPIAKELWVDVKPILIELIRQQILKPSKREIQFEEIEDIDELRFNLWDKITSLVDFSKLKEKVSAAVDKVVNISKALKDKIKPAILAFIEFGTPIAKDLWVDVKPILIELLKQKVLKPSKREIETDSRSNIREKVSALVDQISGKTSEYKQKLKQALIDLLENGKHLASEYWPVAKPILATILKTGIKLAPAILAIVLPLVG